jgi:hypothetical protein
MWQGFDERAQFEEHANCVDVHVCLFVDRRQFEVPLKRFAGAQPIEP